ncbi:hypothetical protein [Pseudomonas sp. BN102]|uniref:hypothetical protein n=1 Tax=Pseudomonas sp. BN102 TaxID=2567886 RepID=UPI002454FE7F|nr:hypothetical protein [Pseudomonas sp. BN102]MDH4610428.1 hypothetical protein [Pseudomonas sp. BN102]
MPKAITQSETSKIAKMIREWPQEDALTWNNICEGSKSILGYTPTRQALSGKPMLKNAYQIKREHLKRELEKFKNIPRPRNMVDAMKKIERLQAENDLLRAELAKMAEIAQRFIHNGSSAGLSPEKLMAPIPKIQRT